MKILLLTLITFASLAQAAISVQMEAFFDKMDKSHVYLQSEDNLFKIVRNEIPKDVMKKISDHKGREINVYIPFKAIVSHGKNKPSKHVAKNMKKHYRNKLKKVNKLK